MQGKAQLVKQTASLPRQHFLDEIDPVLKEAAIRTAFVARFIVLREGRRTRAHRTLEQMKWTAETTARELAQKFRQAFIDNGDKLGPVDRDLQRALKHAERSAGYFVEEYVARACLSFLDALSDYERSNRLLFGDDPKDVPRKGGWRVSSSQSDEDERGSGKE